MSASVMEIAGKKLVQGIFRDTTERKQAEESLKLKDFQIRKAYVDVLSAVTGGKLVILTKEELKEDLGKPISDTFSINSYKELADSRENLLKALNELPFLKKPDRGVLAADEALTNAVKHTGSGTFQVFKKDKIAQILISDSGSGIDFSTLPKATLLAGYSTRQTLGAGFSVMLELSNRVLLATDPGGTQIVLEIGAEEKEKVPFRREMVIK